MHSHSSLGSPATSLVFASILRRALSSGTSTRPALVRVPGLQDGDFTGFRSGFSLEGKSSFGGFAWRGLGWSLLLLRPVRSRTTSQSTAIRLVHAFRRPRACLSMLNFMPELDAHPVILLPELNLGSGTARVGCS